MKVIHAFIEPIIQNVLSLRDTGVDLEGHTFLEHLVKSDSGMIYDVQNTFLFTMCI